MDWDSFKEEFMKIFALKDLQKVMTGRSSEKIGHPMKAGGYVDMADSYHIYMFHILNNLKAF
jgi:hypothetical protein